MNIFTKSNSAKVRSISKSINGKTILITGGTGSFGKKMIETLIKNFKPKKLIVFSRDELKQSQCSMTIKARNLNI